MPLHFLKKIYASLPIIREMRATHSLLAEMNDRLALIATVDASRLVDFELKAHPRYSSPKRLNAFEKKINSQNGEDGILQEIFRRIGVSNRFFAEFGVGDGLECNTAFLLSQGWTGAWIDGVAAFRDTVDRRADLQGRLKPLQAFIKRENISTLLSQVGAPQELDLLSIDIDQNTFYAWEGITGFRSRVVVVEYNSVVPAAVEWKPRYNPDRLWDYTNNYGASLKSFETLGRVKGYSLVGCDFSGVNAFFVRNDLVGDHFEAPFTAENHYEPPRFDMFRFRRGHKPTILESEA